MFARAATRQSFGRTRRPAKAIPMPKIAAAALSFQPLYVQIKGLLEKSLEAREWGPGRAIPSEIELAGRFGVSQGTVRKAIDALAADNLVVRRQGKGTFVATHPEEHASKFRFLRIHIRRGKAGVEGARLLALRPGDPLLVLRRVLEWSGEPVVLDEITLPAVLFRGLTRAKYEAYHGPMYGFFETQFGVRMLKAQEKLSAIAADAASAAILGVATGTPLLAVDRVTLTYGDRPVEVRRGLCTTRAHHYCNELF